jgi:hypothetical protein
MFETTEFRDSLTKIVEQEARSAGLRQYQTSVVYFLQNLATENESELVDRELRKAAGLRRGVPDALGSARELIKTASDIARAVGRDTLTLPDMQAAYRVKFCQVWPFCKQ